jgi:hypothetical protein
MLALLKAQSYYIAFESTAVQVLIEYGLSLLIQTNYMMLTF